LPLRSFGISSAIRPARVSQSRSRYPLRWTSRSGERAPFAAPVRASTSASIIRSAAKASISRTRSPSACFSTSSISAILSSVIVISVVGSRCRNPNHLRRSAMTASVTRGRALRYAGGSARGLLHHVLGHCRRYSKVKAQSEREAFEALRRDRAEKDGLIISQIEGRQKLQHDIRAQRQAAQDELLRLRQDVERYQSLG